MELDAQGVRHGCCSGVTSEPVNKVHHVHTIARIAEMRSEDEDWLWNVANEMDQDDGPSSAYDPATTALWRSPTSASNLSKVLST